MPFRSTGSLSPGCPLAQGRLARPPLPPALSPDAAPEALSAPSGSHLIQDWTPFVFGLVAGVARSLLPAPPGTPNPARLPILFEDSEPDSLRTKFQQGRVSNPCRPNKHNTFQGLVVKRFDLNSN